jgi:hypothetical protein
VKAEEAVRKVAGSGIVKVIGRPMQIETNLQGRNVTLSLPVNMLDLPKGEAERKEILDNLVIFIEHSDGTTEVVQGILVNRKDGSQEMKFTVNRFSTFTMVYVEGWKNAHLDKNFSAYIKGYTDGTFRPDQHVTRAQMAVMLMRNLGLTADLGVSAHYVDVLDSYWAYREIMQAKQSGIMLGAGTSFNPNGHITRAQMATIVYRWLKNECAKDSNAFEQCSALSQPGVDSSYRDVASHHWAAEAIVTIKPFGIMEGYEDGTFKPNENLTRAQAVKVLNRLFKRKPIEGNNVIPSFSDVPVSHWAFREIEEAVRER